MRIKEWIEDWMVFNWLFGRNKGKKVVEKDAETSTEDIYCTLRRQKGYAEAFDDDLDDPDESDYPDEMYESDYLDEPDDSDYLDDID